MSRTNTLMNLATKLQAMGTHWDCRGSTAPQRRLLRRFWRVASAQHPTMTGKAAHLARQF